MIQVLCKILTQGIPVDFEYTINVEGPIQNCVGCFVKCGSVIKKLECWIIPLQFWMQGYMTYMHCNCINVYFSLKCRFWLLRQAFAFQATFYCVAYCVHTPGN